MSQIPDAPPGIIYTTSLPPSTTLMQHVSAGFATAAPVSAAPFMWCGGELGGGGGMPAALPPSSLAPALLQQFGPDHAQPQQPVMMPAAATTLLPVAGQALAPGMQVLRVVQMNTPPAVAGSAAPALTMHGGMLQQLPIQQYQLQPANAAQLIMPAPVPQQAGGGMLLAPAFAAGGGLANAAPGNMPGGGGQAGGGSGAAGPRKRGLDARLVCGTALEVAWEVTQRVPQLNEVLQLQRGRVALRNVAVTKDGLDDDDNNNETAATWEPRLDQPLTEEQLLSQRNLVNACRLLPARARDDLLRAAHLAGSGRDPRTGADVVGTGLLPFFWRAQGTLRYLMRQPASVKGQLQAGQIDNITQEQRLHGLNKTVAQRVHLANLLVTLYRMLQVPAAEAAAMHAAAAAAGQPLA